MNTKRLRQVKVISSAAFVLFVATLALAGGASGSVQVGGSQSAGSTVLVEVVNTGSSPADATVTVGATVGGAQASSSTTVEVPAGGSVIVPVSFPGSVEVVLCVEASPLSATGDEFNPF